MTPDQSTRPRSSPSSRRRVPSAGGGSPPRPSTTRSRTRAAATAASTAAEESQQVASTAKQRSQQVASTAVERSQRVASVARQDAGQLAGTAREQASQVTQEVRAQGRQLVEDARREVQSQVSSQADRVTQGLRRMSSEAAALAEGRPQQAGSVGHYVEEIAERLDAWAEKMDTLGVDGMVEEAKAFARRRPAAFVMGAAVAGFGVGRILRAGKEETAEEPEAADLSPAPAAPRSSRYRQMARAQ